MRDCQTFVSGVEGYPMAIEIVRNGYRAKGLF